MTTFAPGCAAFTVTSALGCAASTIMAKTADLLRFCRVDCLKACSPFTCKGLSHIGMFDTQNCNVFDHGLCHGLLKDIDSFIDKSVYIRYCSYFQWYKIVQITGLVTALLSRPPVCEHWGFPADQLGRRTLPRHTCKSMLSSSLQFVTRPPKGNYGFQGRARLARLSTTDSSHCPARCQVSTS